jgi:hypothetical protein
MNCPYSIDRIATDCQDRTAIEIAACDAKSACLDDLGYR